MNSYEGKVLSRLDSPKSLFDFVKSHVAPTFQDQQKCLQNIKFMEMSVTLFVLFAEGPRELATYAAALMYKDTEGLRTLGSSVVAD